MRTGAQPRLVRTVPFGQARRGGFFTFGFCRRGAPAGTHLPRTSRYPGLQRTGRVTRGTQRRPLRTKPRGQGRSTLTQRPRTSRYPGLQRTGRVTRGTQRRPLRTKPLGHGRSTFTHLPRTSR